jgi:2-polyprenyl-3-methyl-5-hydroxy-6-metoxy-1,4-benzoquinol methylase
VTISGGLFRGGERVSRWLEETGGARGASYDERFRALAASGVHVHGEADYVSALLASGSVLDAGCGTGRVAVELAARGYDVVGVDNDRSMLDVARRHPLTWVEDDLATLELGRTFDLIVCAGNVMVFLAPGTEAEVVRRLTAHLSPGGLLVSGWRTDRMTRSSYDDLGAEAGLEQVVRHSTWDGDPWHADADWCVAVDRRS